MEKTIFTEVLRARGARAIATLTYDDGVSASARKLDELLEKHGLCASLMIVPSRIMAIPPYHRGYCDRDELVTLCSTGRIDIQSHSYSHLYIAEEGHVDYHPENCTDENREREIRGSLEWLSREFPDRTFPAFAVPGGSYDLKTRELISKTFFSARNAAASLEHMQTLSPKDGIEPGDWYRLRSIWMREAQLDYILAYLDKCVSEGGWFLSGCHNIVGDELGRHNYEMTPETLDVILARIAELSARGELWVASFGDATRYLRECEAANVCAVMKDGGITLSINMRAETPQGLALDARIFNIPLSVKVELPDTVGAPMVKQGEKTLPYRTTAEGERKFLIIECDPWGEDVHVTF